ncbi:hypothetical protein AAMO2058_000005500 [Amorphochlora amoebiformis]
MAVALELGAYAKMVVHAVKHKYRPVCGVLLGNDGSGGTVVKDCVPLFHNYPVGPMLELAMMQIDEFCKESKSTMVGCYWANERLNDTEVPQVARRLGSQIAKYYKNASIILINNEFLLRDLALSASCPQSKGEVSVSLNSDRRDQEAVIRRVAKLVGSTDIVDFDDHLANVNKDWLHQDVQLGGEIKSGKDQKCLSAKSADGTLIAELSGGRLILRDGDSGAVLHTEELGGSLGATGLDFSVEKPVVCIKTADGSQVTFDLDTKSVCT